MEGGQEGTESHKNMAAHVPRGLWSWMNNKYLAKYVPKQMDVF